MSTTRWIIETECEHGQHGRHLLAELRDLPCHGERCGAAHTPDDPHFDCPGMSRIVVDPDNLPPEAIQRVADELARLEGHAPGFTGEHWTRAESLVRAFLVPGVLEVEGTPNDEGLFRADLAFLNVVKTGGTQAEGVRAAVHAYLAAVRAFLSDPEPGDQS